MATLQELVVAIKSDINAMKQGFSQVKQQAQDLGKSFQDVGKRVSGVGKTMTKWVTGPIVAAATGLFGLALKAGYAADELLDLSDQTGLSTDTLQEFRYVAERAGVSQDAVAKASMQLTRRLHNIEKGSGPAAEAIERLGLSTDEFMAMSQDERINVLINRLADIEDASERNTIAAQLFGGAWKDIAPILGLGADEIDKLRGEAHELGRVLDRETLEAANRGRIAFDHFKGQMSAAAMAIGAELLPVLTDFLVPVIQDRLIPAIQRGVERVIELIKWFQGLSPTMQKVIVGAVALVAALGPILWVVGNIITLVGKVIPLFKALGVVKVALLGPVGLVVAAIAGLIAIGVAMWRNWDSIRAFASQIWNAIRNIFVQTTNGIRQTVTNVFNGVRNTISNVLNAARSIVVSILSGIRNSFSSIFSGIRSVVTSGMDGVRSAVSNGITSALDAVRNFFGRFRDAGRRIITSIADGIKSAISSVTNAISSVTQAVRRFLPFSPAKEGPLKDLDKLDFGGPITDSIERGLPKIETTLRKVLDVPTNVSVAGVGGTTATNVTNITNMGGRYEVVINLDGREVARATVPHLELELERQRRMYERARGER